MSDSALAPPSKCSTLEVAAVVSLAILLQGMLLWQFLMPGSLAGARGLIVGGIAAILNLAVAVRRGLRSSRRVVLLTLCLLASIITLFLSTLRFEPSAYGLWKSQGFALYAVMPSVAILWNHRDRPCSTRLLFKCMLILAVVPMFLPLLIRQAAGAGSLRWVLLHLDFDVIGISRSLGVGCILALTMIAGKCIRVSMLLFAYFIVLVYGQIVVGERGPVIALVTGVAVIGSRYWRQGSILRASKVIRFGVIALVVLVSVSAMTYLVVQRLHSEHKEHRLAIASQGWSDFQSSPIMGIGVGRFRFEEGAVGTRQFVHNIIAELLLESGIVGLMIFGAYFFVAWHGLNRNDVADLELQSLRNGSIGLFTFAVVSSMVSGDLTTNYLVWVTQALMAVTFSNNGGNGLMWRNEALLSS